MGGFWPALIKLELLYCVSSLHFQFEAPSSEVSSLSLLLSLSFLSFPPLSISLSINLFSLSTDPVEMKDRRIERVKNARGVCSANPASLVMCLKLVSAGVFFNFFWLCVCERESVQGRECVCVSVGERVCVQEGEREASHNKTLI